MDSQANESFIKRLVSRKRLVVLSKELEQAGQHQNQITQFLHRQFFFSVIGLAAGGVSWFFQPSPLPLLTFPLLGYFLPLLLLKRQIKRRQREIKLTLPYYLDLLTLALEAGLDLIAATEEIISRDSPHPLQEELQATLNSIRIGTPRHQAFIQLAERTKVEALSILASSITQSTELGSSLGDLFRRQALDLRRRIFREAEEEAQRAPLKMLIPLVGCIFPVVFVLLFAPIAMRILAIH